MITLGELIALVLPIRDESGSAPSLLDREVTWATRPRPSPPAFAHLSGGELVLLRQEDLHDVDDRLTLDVAIRQLAGFGVSATSPKWCVLQALRKACTRSAASVIQPRIEAVRSGDRERAR